MKYEVSVEGQTYTIEVNERGHIMLDGERVDVDFAVMGVQGLYSLLVNNESFEAMVDDTDGLSEVLLRGYLYEVRVVDERTKRLSARTGGLLDDSAEITIRAPMPGLVVAVPVEAGQTIGKGENVVILESMKMENELKAPRDGVIARVNVKGGDSVEQNEALVVIGPAAATEEG